MSYAATVEALRGTPPRYLGVRFDAHGRALPCAGCTVIGHIRPGPVAEALRAAVDRLRAEPAARCFAWLPAPSWHMTLFDGLLHAVRDPDRWAEGLDPDADGAAVDAWFLRRAAAVPAPDSSFLLRPRAVEPAPGAGVWVALDAESPAEEARLRGYRDALAAATGLARRPGHASYGFHITLAYPIAWPAPAEAAAFEAALAEADAALRAAAPRIAIGPPEICRFAAIDRFEAMTPIT